MTKLLEHVRSLEELLKLPVGFFSRVLKEDDDWSFIIKTHALIESGTTRFLEAVTTPSIPTKFVETLPLSGGRHSKLELLQQLGHLEADHVKFIKRLSPVRNLLVHNVSEVGFVLTTYLASLSPQDVETFLNEACRTSYYRPNRGEKLKQCTRVKFEQERKESRRAILANPRFYVWRTALFYLAITSLRIDTVKINQRADKAERKKLEHQAAIARKIAQGLRGGPRIRRVRVKRPDQGLEADRQRMKPHLDSDFTSTPQSS